MRLHHAGISVPDLDRSLAWYCAALGLRPGYQFEVPPLKLRGGFALGAPPVGGVEHLQWPGYVEALHALEQDNQHGPHACQSGWHPLAAARTKNPPFPPSS